MIGLAAALTLSMSALANPDFRLPAALSWETSLQGMSRLLEPACAVMHVRKIDPPFLDSVVDRQDQIDCEGFAFQGHPRHVEFVFRDGRFVLAWIMTGPDEDQAMESAMTAAYGPPSSRSRKYVVYARAHAALRLDKHEVLFYSPSSAKEIVQWFD